MERATLTSLYPQCDVTISYDTELWQGMLPDVEAFVTELVRVTLAHTGLGKVIRHCEVSCILSTNNTVQALNAEYRNQDKPTNVLSFPVYVLFPDNYQALIEEKEVVLGDVLLAYETVKHEADTQHISFRHHVAHLIVHGVLHLLGYDHIEDEDAHIMEALEIVILQQFGIENPYSVIEN